MLLDADFTCILVESHALVIICQQRRRREEDLASDDNLKALVGVNCESHILKFNASNPSMINKIAFQFRTLEF